MLDGFVPPLVVAGAALVLLALRKVVFTSGGGSALVADLAIVVVIVALAGALEVAMGRPAKYRHGPIRVWSDNVKSDQNSQQIADPYTFTHFIHGAAFYGLTRVAMPNAALGVRAVIALAIEAAWEVYENTDTVVERYRTQTISLGYYGDSVLNSVADIVACAVGFLLTLWLPRSATIAWVVTVELLLALWIRDNLTLNVLMLIYPVNAIRTWQMRL